jgi:adenylate kinase
MKIFKLIAMVAIVIGLTGCGKSTVGADFTGYSKVCVDGVQYLQFPSGVTPQYTQENRVVTCN